MEELARLVDVSVSFHGRTVLRNVTATFARSEISVIVGPSGSGKTTLLCTINRMNELHAACNTVGDVRLRLAGQWIDAYDRGTDLPELRRRIAMVFQTPNVLPVSIERNFTLPLRLTMNLGRKEIAERMERALIDADLLDEVKDRLRHPASTLSGGQQQRLCLARALALDPDILLLDEPTASLDVRAANRIENLLLGLKNRVAIIAVSHSLGQTCRLADHCLILRDGNLVDRVDRAQLQDANHLRRLVQETF